jgi:hypothetical protein
VAGSGEQYWIDRAQSAEAKLATLKANIDPVIERVKQFKANFGVREKSDGTLDVDFDKFVERLGIEACLELRSVIDEKYVISGAAGEKPRIRVSAASQNG